MVQIVLIAALSLFGTTVSCYKTCGQRNNSAVWPWHVAILPFNEDTDVPSCGGTILNDLFVITSGHCVYDLSGNKFAPSELIVRIDRPSGARTEHVKKLFFPYAFNVNKFENDVVLLKLQKPIAFSDDVGPICFSEDSEVSHVGSVTIPIFTNRNKTVRTVEWRITDSTLCHLTNNYIFNASFDHSVCMGHLLATDKFQFHRGSGLIIQRNNAWHLHGILLFTVGPNENDPTYGGGLLLATYAKAFRKISNKHLITSVSDTKCEYYNKIAIENTKSYFHPTISLKRKNDNYVMPDCFGTLISENIILTAAICTQALENVVAREDIMIFKHYKASRIHFHPNDMNRQGIALVELDENISNMGHFINCLWTDDEDPLEFNTQFKHGSMFIKLDAKVRYRPGEAISYRFEDCHSFTVSLACKPGDVLATKKPDEKVQRILGLITKNVYDCGSKTTLNVVSYLDWIEEIAWGNFTRTNGN